MGEVAVAEPFFIAHVPNRTRPMLRACYGRPMAGRAADEDGADGSWSPPTKVLEIFDAFAEGIESRSPKAAILLRRTARDPLALNLLPERPTWDMPHRLLAAVRWMVLDGQAEEFETAANPWLTTQLVAVASAMSKPSHRRSACSARITPARLRDPPPAARRIAAPRNPMCNSRATT